MAKDHRALLSNITTFPSLVKYLRDELDWPIDRADFEDLTYDYTPNELGIDTANAAKIEGIKRLRPLTAKQPWGIFFVKFEQKRLPVVALRRILNRVVRKKRASANRAERVAWEMEDLLFVSNYGEGDQRQISLAHFSLDGKKGGLPRLKVLGWDNRDTPLHLDRVAEELHDKLVWPEDEDDVESWREQWGSAFTLGHGEVITTSKRLAERLAVLARGIRDRIETVLDIETEDGPLTKLMDAFKEALVHDLDASGFADMYAQTIAYGLLSTRISDPEGKTDVDLAAHMRTNPFLKELLETFLHVGGQRGKAGEPGIDFDELGVSEVVELLDQAEMEAVVRDFGDRNPLEDPVIHFYENFLAEYDKDQKVSRGVFYTPRPVVSFIVRSVDQLLRTEFGLSDGLADITTWGEMADRNIELKIPEGVPRDRPFVQVLDPAAGTGTFLVEIIDLIHKTMLEKWRSEGHEGSTLVELWNQYVPRHLLPRLHGYELLMAPYAIAHLKIGLKLYETGYQFGSKERARVFLTNALEPSGDVQLALDFLPALAHEARAVSDVKRDQVFTSVVGNPPYANFGQLNRIPFILDLLGDYKRDLNEKKINLDDDFIKFFRYSQHLLSKAGGGVVGLITNNTFMDAPTRRGMRRSLASSFRTIRIIDLHGNSVERECCPDGSPDVNVFEIKQGVAISFLTRTSTTELNPAREVLHTDLWGLREEKYSWLLRNSVCEVEWSPIELKEPLLRFQPQDGDSADEYESFYSLSDAMPLSGSGVSTDRDRLCFDFDLELLASRMQRAFNGEYSAVFAEEFRIVDSSSYNLTQRLHENSYDENALHPCLYRLFDSRWLYYKPGFTSRPAWGVMRHLLGSNLALLAKRQARDAPYDWFFVADGLVVNGLFSIDNKGREQIFPLYLLEARDAEADDTLRRSSLNLSPEFRRVLCEKLGLPQHPPWDLPKSMCPEDIFNYIYAVFFSPEYRQRYSGQLRTGFPRIPVTDDNELFGLIASKGRQLVALHLIQSTSLGDFITTFEGSQGQMVERVSFEDGAVWLDSAKSTGFCGVPDGVWSFHIGGHRVCEKWLKDRKGRTLSQEDIAHYQRIVVALNETIRIMGEIDEVIEEHGGWPSAFQPGTVEDPQTSYSADKDDLLMVAEAEELYDEKS